MIEQNLNPREQLSSLIDKYAPEIKDGLTAQDNERLIARLSMDKALAEKHINTLIDKLIKVHAQNEELTAQNEVLKAQFISLTKQGEDA